MEANPVAQAVGHLGGPSAVARLRKRDGLRGKTPWAISKWIAERIPAENVLWLSQKTDWKFTPHMLAPTLYPNANDGLPKRKRTTAQSTAAAQHERQGA